MLELKNTLGVTGSRLEIAIGLLINLKSLQERFQDTAQLKLFGLQLNPTAQDILKQIVSPPQHLPNPVLVQNLQQLLGADIVGPPNYKSDGEHG